MKIQMAPSILAADYARLGEELKRAEAAGADWIHADVMDGEFVPNITFGPPVVRRLAQATAVPFDAHLMIARPERHLEAFAEAGAKAISVHAEATDHLHRALQGIRALGVRAGAALNPHTPLGVLEWVMDDLDFVILMCVNPGFGGQKYIPAMTEKIRALREMATARGRADLDIEVDGGIYAETIAAPAEAGANVFVSGTAAFGAPDMRAALARMRENAGAAAVAWLGR